MSDPTTSTVPTDGAMPAFQDESPDSLSISPAPLSVPDPIAVYVAAQAQSAPPPQAGTIVPVPVASAHRSAMTLFAPGPNDGDDDIHQALDLDELLHDCYFGDFPVPELVSSVTIMADPTPVTSVSDPLTAKRTADQAGLLSTDTAAPVTAPFAATMPTAAPFAAIMAPEETTSSSSKTTTAPTASLTQSQKIERRERNREHAKRSRLRKKKLLESLQEQNDGLQSEIQQLKSIIKSELPDKAKELLKDFDNSPSGDGGNGSEGGEGKYIPLSVPSGFSPVKTLMEPDYIFRLLWRALDQAVCPRSLEARRVRFSRDSLSY